MFGDIVSDAFAGLIGGLGFATSAQFNPENGIGVFEPTHGSAPKYADYETSIVNPVAMILSAVMMLEHLNEDETAGRIRKAVMEVVAEGKARAYDMLKLRGTPEVVNQGAASTRQMADAIIAKLK
jgi:3-isopropylmalate dehydrogenase